MTPATRRGRRLTIYVGESDRAKGTHEPLAAEIIQRAATAGMAGASAFRGWEGFGSSEHIHTARLLSLSEDLPLVVVIVDTPNGSPRSCPSWTPWSRRARPWWTTST